MSSHVFDSNLHTDQEAQIKLGDLTLRQAFTISQTGYLNVTQIGDDEATPIDTFALYCNTTVASASNRRTWTQYGGDISYYMAAAATYLIDGVAVAHTTTNGLLDINLTTGTNDGVNALNILVTTHDLADGEWAMGLRATVDATAAVTATSNSAAIYLDTPTDPGATNVTYGIYIETGWDFGLASLSPVMLATLTLAPAADPTPYPLDFQLEGWGVAGTGTVGVYTQGRVINMEYGAARTLDGTLHGLYMDFTTNVTQSAQTITGIEMLLDTTDEANVAIATVISKDLANTSGAGVSMTNSVIDITVALTNSVALSTVDWNDYFIDLDYTASQADATNTFTGGFISMLTTESVGTLTIYGDMVSLTVVGTVDTGQTLRGYYMNGDAVVCGAGETFYAIHVDIDGMTTGGTIAGLRLDVPAGTDAIQIGDGSINWIPGAADTFVIAPTAANLTIFDFELESEFQNGTLINANFAAGPTGLTGVLQGINLDFSTNVTPNDEQVNGLVVALPANVSPATTGVSVITTQDQGSAIHIDIDSNVAAGQSVRGIYMDVESAVAGAGEFFYGLDIDMDEMTTGGTVYGIYLQMPAGTTGEVIEAITGNDVANDIIGTAITKTLTITAAGDVAMTNPIADMNATLTNAGGGKASWDNYFIDMDYAASQADDTNTWSGGFISMVATESVGTLNLQGNMVDMVLPGTQSADLVGIHLDFNQDANAHNFYGIEVDGVGMTPGAGNEYGIYVHGAFDYDIYTDGPVFFDTIDITPSTDIDALDILGTNMTSAAAIHMDMTAKVSGNVVNLSVNTSTLTASTTVYNTLVSSNHDGLGADTLIGNFIDWTGNVPNGGANSNLTFYHGDYGGIWGGGGAEGGVLTGYRFDLTGTVNGSAMGVVGFYFDGSATWTSLDDSQVIYANITTGANAAAWSGTFYGTYFIANLGDGAGNVTIAGELYGDHYDIDLSSGAGTVVITGNVIGYSFDLAADAGTSMNGSVFGSFVSLAGAATAWGNAWTDLVYGAYYSINPTGTINAGIRGAEWVMAYTRPDPSDANAWEEGGLSVDATGMSIVANTGGGSTTYYGFHFDGIGATLTGDFNYGVWVEMPAAYGAGAQAAARYTGNGNTVEVINGDGIYAQMREAASTCINLDIDQAADTANDQLAFYVTKDMNVTSGAGGLANSGTVFEINADTYVTNIDPGAANNTTLTGIRVYKRHRQGAGTDVGDIDETYSGPTLDLDQLLILNNTNAGTPTITTTAPFIDMDLDITSTDPVNAVLIGSVDWVSLDVAGGDVTAAAELRGYYFTSTITLNHANAEFYGYTLDTTGMTDTLSQADSVGGIFINDDGILDYGLKLTNAADTVYLMRTEQGRWLDITMGTATTDAVYITADFGDENNALDIFVISHDQANTTAAADIHTGYLINYQAILSNTNGGGSVARSTNPLIGIDIDLDETGGAVTWDAIGSTGSVLDINIARITAGTPTVAGDIGRIGVGQATAAEMDTGGSINLFTLWSSFEVQTAHTAIGLLIDSDLTLNGATAIHYGAHIDLDGITITDASALSGLLIDMASVTTPTNADYLAAIQINVADGIYPAIDTNARMSVSGRIEEGAYHWKDHFSGRVWKGQWATDGVNNAGDVNAVGPTSDLNGQTRLRTNAAAGAVMERHWNDICCFDSDYHTVIEIVFIVRTATADLGDLQLEFGLIDAAETTYARIQADYNTDTEWHVQSSAAGAGTMDDAAAETIAQDVRIKFRIEILDNSIATGLRTFLGQDADPTLEATTDAVNEIPASGVTMQPYVKLTSRAAGGGTQQIIDIDKVEILSDLP